MSDTMKSNLDGLKAKLDFDKGYVPCSLHLDQENDDDDDDKHMLTLMLALLLLLLLKQQTC